MGERAIGGTLLTLGWVATGIGPVASAVALMRSGWAPLFDERGTIAALTVDSLSLDPPLVGMPTALGVDESGPLSHAGPLGFWLLAGPAKLMGPPGEGLIVGALMVALLSIAAVAVMVRRRRDVRLEVLTLVLVTATVAALGGSVLTDPFNPYLGALPFLVSLVAAWGVLSGHDRQLWVFVVAASLTAQTHLGFVPLIVSLVVVLGVALAVEARRTSGPRRRRLTRSVVPVGIVLGLVAWIGPIADQIAGSGNLVRLWRAQASGDGGVVAGVDHGLALAVEMTSIPPLWLQGEATNEAIADPGLVRILPSVVAVSLVVAIAAWAVRRRDRGLASLGLVSLVSVLVATLSSARVNRPYSGVLDPETLLSYRIFWWPVGMMFLLTLLWGSYRFVSAMGSDERRLGAVATAVPLWSAAAVVVLVLVVAQLGYRSPPDGWDDIFGQEADHARAVADLADHPRVVLLRFTPEGTATPEGPMPEHSVSMGLVAQLRLRGITVHFPSGEDSIDSPGFAYRERHRSTGDEDVVLLYRLGPAAHAEPPAGYRTLSEPAMGPDEPPRPFAVPSSVLVQAPS